MVMELTFTESIIKCTGYCTLITLAFMLLNLITILGWCCHSHFKDQNTKV